MHPGAKCLPSLEQASQSMPFDQFGRYHMMREAIDACRTAIGAERLSILDVGGFYLDKYGQPQLPLKPFVPDDDLTVIDVVPCDLPGYIQGDGTGLAFPDNHFDLIVSADTLEHIPQPRRQDFWRELLRVARHGVILLAPFGSPEVTQAEALLFQFIKIELQAVQEQLQEHVQFGLPVLKEWMDFLAERGVAARSYPTGYLHAWLGMMLIKHALMRTAPDPAVQEMVDSYYNNFFFPTERRNPAYRHLIIAEKTAGLVDSVDAALAPTIMPDQPDASSVWQPAMMPLLTTLIQHQLGDLLRNTEERVAHANERVIDARARLAQLGGETAAAIEAYRQQISLLERTLADRPLTNDQVHAMIGASTQHLHALLEGERATKEAAINDLTAKVEWLEQQNNDLRNQLEAIKQGRVMRVMNKVSSLKERA